MVVDGIVEIYTHSFFRVNTALASMHLHIVPKLEVVVSLARLTE